jgi:glycosyltransferase involved in cell wall biosynthesis
MKYGRPKVSVCIPLTPEHTDFVYDALDSLEGQTFKEWECIVSYDAGVDPASEWDWSPALHRLRAAFPFVRFTIPETPGAGAARNAAADLATAPYLLWLDADDWLEPKCLETFFQLVPDHMDDILYSDYVGRAYGVSNAEELKRQGRLMHYEEDTGFAIMRYHSADYDCARAHAQPQMSADGQFYIWNLITSLTPKRYHDQIGGFDEEMKSWEDWDYWLRMARAGICFTRIPKYLVSYRFYTGTRREIGRQNAADLLDYLRAKYEGDEPMPCSGCGRKRANPTVIVPSQGSSPITAYSSNDMVRVKFVSNSFGEPVTVRDQDTNQLHDYGYRAGGATFMMLRKHAEQYAGKFEIIEDVGQIKAEPIQPEPPKEAPPPPEPIEEPEPVPVPVKRPTKRRGTRTRRTSTKSTGT